MESSYTIDRFEEDEWAVLEDEHSRTFTVPRRWLPSEAREGDVVKLVQEEPGTGARVLRFELDPAARAEGLAEALRLRDRLPREPKGDLSL